QNAAGAGRQEAAAGAGGEPEKGR
ncbi:hypothetical protein AZ044_003641, partial [Pluralibacter gergoviae]